MANIQKLPFNSTLKKSVVIALGLTLISGSYLGLATAHATQAAPVKAAAAVDLRFPGKVAPDAKREKSVTVTVETHLNDYTHLDACSPENWQSTGLYAAPGETITLSLADHIPGLKVQIGSHRDQLEDIPPKERLRAPIITVEKDLKKGENKISNPYGGLIYIIPTEINVPKASTKITIKNAIKAPNYVLGVTSEKEWLQWAANPKVPMAELISKKVILTVPSQYLKDVKDPKKLMETWDQIVDLENKLAGLNPGQAFPHRAPQEPWRYVADIQISWGYMYAGYPIMLYDDPCIKDLLSVQGLKTNGWGFYHELGHNQQQSKWTPEALVEVSCNIFSLYIQEFYGNPSALLDDNADTGQSSFKDAIQFVTSDRQDKNFMDESQVHIFTRLVMFWQLKETYGWNVYPELFKSMRNLPLNSDIEPSEQEKLELMVKQLCKITGDDLTPFFEHWGIKLSPATKAYLQSLSLKPLKDKIWLLSQ